MNALHTLSWCAIALVAFGTVIWIMAALDDTRTLHTKMGTQCRRCGSRYVDHVGRNTASSCGKFRPRTE